MSIFDKIITLSPTAPRITIYGKAGVGKTTLASQFPEPYFLQTEEIKLDGAKAFPVATKFPEVWDTLVQLNKEENLPFKTLVIDSISKLDSLIIDYILDNEPLKDGKKTATIGSACGGYGKGYERAQQLHRAFKGLCDNLNKKGITIIYIAHLSTAKYRAPDSDDYDIYSITMNHDKSKEPYIDDVDAVFFCKLKSYITESKEGKKLVNSTEQHIILTGVSDGHISKNRFSMPIEIKMEFEEIKKYIPFYNNIYATNLVNKPTNKERNEIEEEDDKLPSFRSRNGFNDVPSLVRDQFDEIV